MVLLFFNSSGGKQDKRDIPRSDFVSSLFYYRVISIAADYYTDVLYSERFGIIVEYILNTEDESNSSGLQLSAVAIKKKKMYISRKGGDRERETVV